MIKSFFKITVLVFFLKGIPLCSQNCDFILSGTIKDLHDGSPIFGAVIRIEGSDVFAQTQEKVGIPPLSASRTEASKWGDGTMIRE